MNEPTSEPQGLNMSKEQTDWVLRAIEANTIGGTDDFPCVNIAGLIGDLSATPAEAQAVACVPQTVLDGLKEGDDRINCWLGKPGHKTSWVPLYLHPASPSPAGGVQGVKVKALEWKQNWPNDPLTAWACVEAIGRTYTVDHDGPRFYVSTNILLSEAGSDALGNFDSFDAAKAAAQSDYEQRILSVLHLAPSEGTVQAVEKYLMSLGISVDPELLATIVDAALSSQAQTTGGVAAPDLAREPIKVTPLKPHEFSADPYTSKCMYCGRGRGRHDEGIRAWEQQNALKSGAPDA